MLILLVILTTVVVVGLAAIALAEPRGTYDIAVWNDEAERRLLRERRVNAGWW